LKPKPKNNIEITKNSCYSYVMRLFSKIFFILSLLSVLYALSPHPIYALACSGTGYTCRLFDCAVGEVEDTSRTCTLYDYICCKKVPTSTPAPQPSITEKPEASPTVKPPTATPASCSSTNDCAGYCAGIPNCSAACINGYCVFTNPTLNNSQCNTWGNWSGCISGQDACGGCADQGYTCQTRFCTNPSNANLYQISCGCGQPTSGSGGGGGGGGGGTNPTNTPTPTTAPTNTPTSIPTPTINPYWVKLKNTSFYTSRSLVQSIPASPISYDADDDGTAYFIIASFGSDPGVVAASYINLGTASVSAKNWKTTEPQNPFTFTPSQFLAYLKTRTALKTITNINNISSINSDTVVFNGNLTINSANISLFNSKKLVLLVDGNLNINVNFAPSSSSIALLSTGTITISPSVSQVNAILIGQNVDLGTTTNQGLKIVGNLVAIESLTNNRKWSTSSRPAVFVVFDKNLYLDLLPHLAVIKYSWRETQ
jgi:hypothetical protein